MQAEFDLTEEFEERFIKPIINASYPGTLAALSLAVLQVTGLGAGSLLKYSLALGALGFLLSSFFLFFYTVYPTRRRLWTGAAFGFLFGLTASLLSIGLIVVAT